MLPPKKRTRSIQIGSVNCIVVSHSHILVFISLVELSNTQLAFQGVEKPGFVIASSFITQIRGHEHSPKWREGDLVAKKSWVANVQDLQFLCTYDLKPEDKDFVPWLPNSVIHPPGMKKRKSDVKGRHEEDEAAAISSLLNQLGPDLSNPLGSRGIVSSTAPGEAVGGLVTSIPDPGRIVEGSQLQVL